MGRFILIFFISALVFALVCDLLLIAGTLRILNFLQEQNDQINQHPEIELFEPGFEPSDSSEINIAAFGTKEF